MKIRVIAAFALLPALLIIVLVLPKFLTAVLFGVLGAIAAYELLLGTGLVTQPRLVAYAMIMAFMVAVLSYYGLPYAWGLLGLLLFTGLLFMEMMVSHIKLPFDRIMVCFAAGILIPYLFNSLVRIQAVDGTGRFFVMIPFILAFLSDSGAYFVGRFLGKHKLAPVISPNKTIEGAFGGIVSAVLGMLVYALVLNVAFRFQVDYFRAILYGILGALGGMFGDLAFSVIKRQTGIKDYGNLIPGHGGILDRFDSMMIVGPLSELLLILMPLAVK